MQRLLIVPRLMPEVRAGKKRHTIRWQEAAIHPGPLLYINTACPDDVVRVTVTHVITLPLSRVAAHLDKTDAWPDSVLLEGMREHYPAIELNSLVEVIHHSAPLCAPSGSNNQADKTMLIETLTQLEQSLHFDKRNNRAWLETILHPGFKEIARSGRMITRAETIESLANEMSPQPLLSFDYSLEIADERYALLNYQTSQVDGSQTTLRTSLWIYSEKDGWRLFFHQGTPTAEVG
ncbi:hypothetical protein RJ498_000370 [Pluralibacter gergoviae]